MRHGLRTFRFPSTARSSTARCSSAIFFCCDETRRVAAASAPRKRDTSASGGVPPRVSRAGVRSPPAAGASAGEEAALWCKLSIATDLYERLAFHAAIDHAASMAHLGGNGDATGAAGGGSSSTPTWLVGPSRATMDRRSDRNNCVSCFENIPRRGGMAKRRETRPYLSSADCGLAGLAAARRPARCPGDGDAVIAASAGA